MRDLINISLPIELSKKVDKAVKTGHYTSKSEFFRTLMRLWEEEQVLKELQVSQKEIIAGKGKILRSLKDLR